MSEAQLVIKKVNLEIEAHSRVRSISRIPTGMSDKLARQSLSRQSHALLVHHGLFDLRRISRLHLYLDAIQFSLEILLRRGVHHFFLDPRGIGDPARMTRDVLHGGANVRRLYRVCACGTLPLHSHANTKQGGQLHRDASRNENALTMRRIPPCSCGNGPPSRTRSRRARIAGCSPARRRQTRRSQPGAIVREREEERFSRRNGSSPANGERHSQHANENVSPLSLHKYMRPRDVARSTGLRRSAAASSCPPSLHGHASHKNHAEVPLGPGRLMCGVAAVRSFAVCRLHVRPLRRTDLL